ncbi:hypothetical protein [Leptothoe sp. PORK10 BA2]|uniref:hypothetical protein n=1 Tax=Leptothoe sp. PORK10 BA2 TaxID=3110254 RepID=UPI002B1F2B6C|nr:hypothetical protein [Leptothoe sp. PORK10 BA2]MEA5462870.1 hypothetical protein [Leptothoe sp. PORK10 BA2]
MWQLSQPVVKSAEFNFSNPDGGLINVTQLWQGDICLINALGYVNWQDAQANFQFELCETCCYPGCRPQGWVSIRKLGERVLILPAFETIANAANHLRQEYLPPAYLHGGAVWLEHADYQKVQNLAPFPGLDQLPELSSWEAAKLLQWEAPQKILGDIHSPPQLSADLVIASSEGSFLEQVPIFSALLAQLQQVNSRVIMQTITPSTQIISFYLDLAGIPHWNALVYDGGDYKLYLGPGSVLESLY